jgi:hypothetical protein
MWSGSFIQQAANFRQTLDRHPAPTENKIHPPNFITTWTTRTTRTTPRNQGVASLGTWTKNPRHLDHLDHYYSVLRERERESEPNATSTQLPDINSILEHQLNCQTRVERRASQQEQTEMDAKPEQT